LDELTATLIYTQLDDFHQAQVRRRQRKDDARLDSKCRLKDAKITLPEAAGLRAIVQSSRLEQRQIVEGVFSILKRCFGLKARCVSWAASLRSRVWASLAAYMMLGKPAS